MTPPALVERLQILRIDLSISPTGKLHVEAPAGTLTDELRSTLHAHRDELLAELRDQALPPGLKPSYCPGCGGRSTVVSVAATHLPCAACASPWPTRTRGRSREPT